MRLPFIVESMKCKSTSGARDGDGTPTSFLIHHQLFSTSIKPSLHLSISLNLCPWSPPWSSPSTKPYTDLHQLTALSPSCLSGLGRHITPPHLVSFPLTLEQMAEPGSLCVSLTDRRWSSTSIDKQSYVASLQLSSFRPFNFSSVLQHPCFFSALPLPLSCSILIFSSLLSSDPFLVAHLSH